MAAAAYGISAGTLVGLGPSNWKLRRRAIRIVRTLTDHGEPMVMRALEAADWVIKKATRKPAQPKRRRARV